MGNNSSRNGEASNRRYVYAKRTKAIPTAYVPPEKRVIPNGTHTTQRVITPNGTYATPRVITQDIPEPEIKGDLPSEPPSPSEKDAKIDITETEIKTTEHKGNGYIKNSKHKRGPSEHSHVVYREKSHKLYDPEYVIQRDKSYRLYNDNPELVAPRPKSYIHYERVKPEYTVRERGYKMYEPRHQVRKVAHTYATLRRQPEVVSARPVREIHTARPKSEILVSQTRPVRVVRSAPPAPVVQTVRARTIGRPVIVRRSAEPERIYATPEHGYIPRHTLGQYRPKVIDGYVAPSRVEREVLVEPIYQTVKKVPPPAYPGRPSEREKVMVEKVEERHIKRQSLNLKNFELKPHPHQTDDEKLKDIPSTQYIDDGKTIMIIDYLLDPFSVKKVPPTVTMELNQNGDVLNVKEADGHSEKSLENDDLNDSINRQRSPEFGDVNFLP